MRTRRGPWRCAYTCRELSLTTGAHSGGASFSSFALLGASFAFLGASLAFDFALDFPVLSGAPSPLPFGLCFASAVGELGLPLFSALSRSLNLPRRPVMRGVIL